MPGLGTPLSFCSTPQANLCLWRRGLLLKQSSPQTGLPTPKGAPQLGSYLIRYEPLSIIRVNKDPGEYRHIPNWIGQPDCGVEEARFVPIGADQLPQAMTAWEHYINSNPGDNGNPGDRLVQLAILHAEFEALHPFLDGNGRMGRILVPLFLWQVALIRAPVFYISAYLEAHREAYYDHLLAVSRDDNWTGWCHFFLEAIRQQAEDNCTRVQSIIELYDAMKDQVINLTHSQYGVPALDWIFRQPIFKSTDFVNQADIPEATARRILKCLRDNNICTNMEKGRGRRPALLVFPQLLEITEGNQIS